jgi:hypothetical protein
VRTKFHNDEFSPEILQMLRKRDVLGQANPTQLIPLVYNAHTESEMMEERFDAERKENPLLETTPPEAWLTAEVMPAISAIRANAEVKDSVLVAALLRYFRRAVPLTANEAQSEQELWTGIGPYQPALKKLFRDLYDRRKSLGGILGIPVAACTIREAMTERKPSSRREEIMLRGIAENRSNQYIARLLDKSGLKPRTYKSYPEMLHVNPQDFYALKSGIKIKYRASLRISRKQPKA